MANSDVSAAQFLVSIGKGDALKLAPRGHRLDVVRDDIVSLYLAGFTLRGIYQWLLEHKPLYADHVKATKSEATDITTIGNYVLRVLRGEIGRKRGRPRKNPATHPAPKTALEPLVALARAEKVSPASTDRTATAVKAEVQVESLTEQLRRQRQAHAAGVLKFSDDPKSDPAIKSLTQGIERDPYALK